MQRQMCCTLWENQSISTESVHLGACEFWHHSSNTFGNFNFYDMIKSSFSIILVLALFALSCGKKEKTVYKTPVTEVLTQTDSPNDVLMLDLLTDKNYSWPGNTDPFEIVSKSISHDSLFITVQYGGGCKDHGFKMITNLMWLKSKPPQLNLYLEHENNEDGCRALVNRTLGFDLRSIRNPSTDKIRLIINDNRESMLEYIY
jgi:hypothetical protein